MNRGGLTPCCGSLSARPLRLVPQLLLSQGKGASLGDPTAGKVLHLIFLIVIWHFVCVCPHFYF